jgi:hypothetical protein
VISNAIVRNLFALTVPYDRSLERSKAHHRLLYAGRSIAGVLVDPLHRSERLSQMGAAA